MVSGLHASVNSHVSRNYINHLTGDSYPNLPMYHQSVGNHTDRIKNLFMVYAAGLRALSIAHDLIKDYDLDTGLDKLQDAET